MVLETVTAQAHERVIEHMCRAVSDDRVACRRAAATEGTRWHTPASRGTAAAQPQFMYPGMRCMMDACCSGRGPVDGLRYDMQTLDNATCRYTSTTVALVLGKHGICCDAEGELPLI